MVAANTWQTTIRVPCTTSYFYTIVQLSHLPTCRRPRRRPMGCIPAEPRAAAGTEEEASGLKNMAETWPEWIWSSGTTIQAAEWCSIEDLPGWTITCSEVRWAGYTSSPNLLHALNIEVDHRANGLQIRLLFKAHWIHWPGLIQPVPRHDFHKVVDLHQLFMVPDEGVIHPDVEHHILSRVFEKIPCLRSWHLTLKGEKQKNHWEIDRNCDTMPYYTILSFCGESLHRPWISTRSLQIALLLLWPSDQHDLLPKAMPQKWLCRAQNGTNVKKHLLKGNLSQKYRKRYAGLMFS